MERVRVLIGDHSAFMRITLKSTMETLGFEVVAAAKNGKEVLDSFVEAGPDITLIDLSLEGMDGLALAKAINDQNPSANVILMVPEGSDDPDVIVRAVKAGIKGYMTKPVSSEKLRARIAETLGGSKE